MERTGPSLTSRIVAVLILAVAAWLLFRVAIGIIAGIAWTLVAIVAVVGVLWALSVLRR